jgi:hypothetical protein
MKLTQLKYKQKPPLELPLRIVSQSSKSHNDITSIQAPSVLDSSTITMPDQASIGMKLTLFPNLPTELRLRIWELASAIPRSVHLRERVCDECRAPDELVASFDPPKCASILHVCRESRDIALKN